MVHTGGTRPAGLVVLRGPPGTGDAPTPARVVLTTFKGAALGGLLTLVVVGGLHATPSAHPGLSAEADAYERVVSGRWPTTTARTPGSARHDPGLGADPQRAGRAPAVSFEVGWDVYNGKRPAR